MVTSSIVGPGSAAIVNRDHRKLSIALLYTAVWAEKELGMVHSEPHLWRALPAYGTPTRVLCTRYPALLLPSIWSLLRVLSLIPRGLYRSNVLTQSVL